MLRRVVVLVATLLLGGGSPLLAQGGHLPFTQEENKDGARFVWHVMGRTGFSYEYIPASGFPTSSEFREVDADSARAGDLAWWPDFVAFYSGAPDKQLILVGDRPTLASVVAVRGKPHFYRKLVPIDSKPTGKPSAKP